MSEDISAELVLPRERCGELLELVVKKGYRLIGPKLEQGAIVFGPLRGVDDLPEGWTDEQSPGRYRAVRRSDASLFGYAAGPRSLRRFFQLPDVELVVLRRGQDGPRLDYGSGDTRPIALIGARGCDLRALAIQDQVLARGAYPDPRYVARRANTLVIAVQCTEPSGSCFCTSMGAGPRAELGFDLALTEVVDAERHHFVVEVGSERGRELVAELALALAAPRLSSEARERVAGAAARMGRRFEEAAVHDALLANLEHPEWDRLGERCLSCTNCTLVCPTCFCTTSEDRIDLTGDVVERHVRHDSCFSEEFSHLHGGSARASIRSRYRQWLTHKFATWYDQFGSSGCVGCGRCITSCPVGIDVTQEISVIGGEPCKLNP